VSEIRHIARLLPQKGANLWWSDRNAKDPDALELALFPSSPEAGGSLAHSFFPTAARSGHFFSWAGGRLMDESVKAFVKRQNVVRYNDQPKTETDPVKRDVLLKLLTEEETKQVKA
jgi:hypothetical protein